MRLRIQIKDAGISHVSGKLGKLAGLRILEKTGFPAPFSEGNRPSTRQARHSTNGDFSTHDDVSQCICLGPYQETASVDDGHSSAR